MEHLPEASTGLPSTEGVPPHSLNLDSRPQNGTEGQRRGVTGGQRTHVCLTTELWPSEVTSCSPNQHLLPCPQPPTWPRAVTSPLSNLPPASDSHRQAYFRDRPPRVLPQVAEGGEGLREESSAKTAVSVRGHQHRILPRLGVARTCPCPSSSPHHASVRPFLLSGCCVFYRHMGTFFTARGKRTIPAFS